MTKELRDKLQSVVDAIAAFDKRTDEDEYTDVCEAWDLLHFAEETIREAIGEPPKPHAFTGVPEQLCNVCGCAFAYHDEAREA